MASAWGNSWGGAWGNSWGSISSVNPTDAGVANPRGARYRGQATIGPDSAFAAVGSNYVAVSARGRAVMIPAVYSALAGAGSVEHGVTAGALAGAEPFGSAAGGDILPVTRAFGSAVAPGCGVGGRAGGVKPTAGAVVTINPAGVSGEAAHVRFARGVQNPTDEEIVAVVLAIIKRRRH